MHAVHPKGHIRVRRAFTLLELLVVVAIIGILASLLLPAIQKTMVKARQTWCASNLRQLGIGLASFAHDHQNAYPQQLPFSAGGANEATRSNLFLQGRFTITAAAYSVLSNELGNPKVLGCPATRRHPTNFARIAPLDLGYALAMNVTAGDALAALAIDRNVDLARSAPLTNRTSARVAEVVWTPERHGNRGNALFADSHVELRANLPVPVAFSGRGPGPSTGPGTSGNGNYGGGTGNRNPNPTGGGNGNLAPNRDPKPPAAPPGSPPTGKPGGRSPTSATGAHWSVPTAPTPVAGSSDVAGSRAATLPTLPAPTGGASFGGGSDGGGDSDETLSARIRRSLLWLFLVIFLVGIGAVLFHAWQRYRALQS